MPRATISGKKTGAQESRRVSVFEVPEIQKLKRVKYDIKLGRKKTNY